MDQPLTPWFDCETQPPVRSGVYDVANKNVCATSDREGKDPYGWVKQRWDASTGQWSQHRNYGFYGNATAGRWRGLLRV